MENKGRDGEIKTSVATMFSVEQRQCNTCEWKAAFCCPLWTCDAEN